MDVKNFGKLYGENVRPESKRVHGLKNIINHLISIANDIIVPCLFEIDIMKRYI